jgi:hypothetical protein
MIDKDLGVLITFLENNDTHEKICRFTSKCVEENKDKQIVILTQYSEKIDTHRVPVLPISYYKYFNGDLIVFDYLSLMLAVESIYADNIFYYTHDDIPWINSYTDYSVWNSIFSNSKIKIIASDHYKYNIYNITWNNVLGVCEEINYEKICKFI